MPPRINLAVQTVPVRPSSRRGYPGMHFLIESTSDHQPPAHDHHYAGRQKGQIPEEMIIRFRHVMNVQDVVVDDSFHEIEKSPTENHRADKRSCRQRNIALTDGVP